MLLIKNGRIINPQSNQDEITDILIIDEIIKDIGKDLPFAANTEIIDAEGMIVAPGLVDIHVHFRDPGFTYKEDIESGAKAAAKGGYTTVVMMANTNPPIDNIETLKYVLNKGNKTGINIMTCAAVTQGLKGVETVDMAALKEAGAIGFTDDGIPLLDEEIVKSALKEAAKIGLPISFHEENPSYIRNNGINEGYASEQLGIYGSSREAEIVMIKRDLALAKEAGAKVVIQHISTKEGVALVRQAKADNVAIFAEAAPHHFTLTEEAVIKKGALAKMNPPLRTEEDRIAVIEGLKDGTIDVIATDHAPHSKEEKERDIKAAPSGIIGLETALSLGIRELVNKGYLTISELIERMSSNPAKLYELPAGNIMIGKSADLVIFDPSVMWVAEEFTSKSQNSPFIGEKMPGAIHYTICKGKVVWHSVTVS
ncbi:MAG: dihydroorotase [Lachnospiraceae bacterium]|nr:dihydroorotase [Lachnospiraceae bacterium]